MNVLVLLPLGGSLVTLESQGQLTRFVDNYISAYHVSFEKVYIATFANETVSAKNFTTLPNKFRIHRYLYALLFPFLYRRIICECEVVRVMQLSSLPTAMICKLLFGARVYVTYGYDYEQFARRDNKLIQAVLFRLLKKYCLFMADKVFFPVKHEYINNAQNKKSVFLPNGVDTRKFTAITTKTPNAKFNILYVGRLEEMKRIDSLFTAVVKAGIKKHTSINLVGQGTFEKNLVKLARDANLEVNFLGNISNSDLPRVYSQANLFVLPSEHEGVSKVLLEAMSCSLPVVARDTKENREIVDNNVNGFLFVNDDNLSDIIRKLFHTPALRINVGQRARKTVKNNYNLPILLQKETQIMHDG